MDWKKPIITGLLFASLSSPAQAFQVKLWGVDVTKDSISVSQVISGVIASHLSHEIGHYAVAEMNGASPELRPSSVTWERGMTEEQTKWTYRGGFLAQAIVGSLLTACPETRGSDFATAFTGYTAVNNLQYSVTGGLQSDKFSDTNGITRNGGNGRIEFATFGTASAYLTYLNLKSRKVN